MPLIDKKNLNKEITDKYSITNNTLKLDNVKNAELDKYTGEPKDEINIIVGDDKQPDIFLPQVKLQRWTNEVNFSVRLKDTEYEKAKVSTLINKIIWEKDNTKIEFYDYSENEGGYKMVLFWKEKPVSNKIKFLVKKKELDFIKQPPLTEEITQEQKNKGWTATETEIKDENGNIIAQRPISIVNSFAIYHSTKGGMNDVNSKEYKCGKAGHDFAPKITDTNGLEAYGKLDYIWFDKKNGERILTIPQDFLDKAIYPIKSNDNFGYTGEGLSNVVISANDVRGSYFTSPADIDTVTDIRAYTNNAFTKYWKGLIALSSDHDIIANGISPPVASTPVKTFRTGTFATPPIILPSTEYLLAIISNSNNLAFYYDGGSAGQGMSDSSNDYDSPENLTPTSTNNNKHSIYCTYTPVAAFDAILKRWTGAAWVKALLKRWSGAAWNDQDDEQLKYYNGAAWKTVDASGP